MDTYNNMEAKRITINQAKKSIGKHKYLRTCR